MFRHMTAMLCCLAFAAGAEAQSLPKQVDLQVKTQIVSIMGRLLLCTERWRYTFRAGRIFEEKTYKSCEGSQIQDGQEGVGAVYEPNRTTTRTRHCVRKAGSKIARCSDGRLEEHPHTADSRVEWTSNFTTTSRVTDRLLEFKETQRDEFRSGTNTYKRIIAIRYSGSGCELAKYTWTDNYDSRIDVTAPACKIVW